jgi:3-oxoadipate enol-lactonase
VATAKNVLKAPGGINHYYEELGGGTSLVFIHGAFADARMWDPQWIHFSKNYRVLRYDLRGHGRTGPSTLERYTIETFADDLQSLLDSLEIQAPILCGQSFGGSIAQAYAARHPGKIKALILAGSMAAIDLSLMDKLLCRVLFPEWAMTTAIRMMSVERFTRFSLQLGRFTKGKQFLSQEDAVAEYLKQCMLQMESGEYIKFWRALYRFKVQRLERITCPTLVLNGEHEPKSMAPHTRELLRRIPHAEGGIVPGARHASNMDNPEAFNGLLEDFLHRVLI